MPRTAPVPTDVLADWLLESLESMDETKRATKNTKAKAVNVANETDPVAVACQTIAKQLFPNMTPAQIAKKTGHSGTAIGDFIKGNLKYGSQVARDLATDAGYDYDELLKGNLVDLPPPRIPEGIDPKLLDLATRISAKGPKQTAKAVQILSVLDDA